MLILLPAALPKGARVLLHCASGNRVAGALYAYWVLNEGLKPTFR